MSCVALGEVGKGAATTPVVDTRASARHSIAAGRADGCAQHGANTHNARTAGGHSRRSRSRQVTLTLVTHVTTRWLDQRTAGAGWRDHFFNK